MPEKKVIGVIEYDALTPIYKQKLEKAGYTCLTYSSDMFLPRYRTMTKTNNFPSLSDLLTNCFGQLPDCVLAHYSEPHNFDIIEVLSKELPFIYLYSLTRIDELVDKMKYLPAKVRRYVDINYTIEDIVSFLNDEFFWKNWEK